MIIEKLISKPLITIWLFVFNVILAVCVFFVFIDQTGGDTDTYIGLADGILKGEYSYWHFTGEYFPDTFRNPGYPLFLAFFRIFSASVFLIQLVQLLMYVASMILMLQVIGKLFDSVEIKNIFLLLLLPSLHVASYTAMIFPEILVTFLILLIIRIDLIPNWNSWYKYIFLSLLFGFLFQVRPVTIFIPFIYVFVKWYVLQKNGLFFKHLLMLVLYFITMIPYGLWNLKNHGHFKITSLEGGGGVFHLGYWAMKIPDHYEGRYWNNYCVREMIPMIEEADRFDNLGKYNNEWDEIDSIIKPLLTDRDTLMIALHNQHPSLFETNNSDYVMKREEILKQKTIDNILRDLPWYVKVKTYSAIRLWVTGVPIKEFESAVFMKRIYLIYPFIITFITFLLSLILIPWVLFKNSEVRRKLIFIFILISYFGIMHVPFTIQSRYTIPVRLELLMALSVSFYFLLYLKRKAAKV